MPWHYAECSAKKRDASYVTSMQRGGGGGGGGEKFATRTNGRALGSSKL